MATNSSGRAALDGKSNSCASFLSQALRSMAGANSCIHPNAPRHGPLPSLRSGYTRLQPSPPKAGWSKLVFTSSPFPRQHRPHWALVQGAAGNSEKRVGTRLITLCEKEGYCRESLFQHRRSGTAGRSGLEGVQPATARSSRGSRKRHYNAARSIRSLRFAALPRI